MSESCFPSRSTRTTRTYTVPVLEQPDVGSVIVRSPHAIEHGLFTLDDLPGIRNCYDAFLRGKDISRNGKSRCLGARALNSDGSYGSYQFESYEEINKRCLDFGRSLLKLNLCPVLPFHDEEKKQVWRFLCLYAKNCPEWNVAEMACYAFGITVVPMYDTLGVSGLQFISSQTQLTTVVCTPGPALRNVIDCVVALRASSLPCSIKNVILFDSKVFELSDEERVAAKEAGLNLYQFFEVEKRIEQQAPLEPPCPSHPDDACLLMYTSGTTGDPKGVKISHMNLLCNLPRLSQLKQSVNADDVFFSYLPSAHIFDRILSLIVYYAGGAIGFGTGDVARLKEDCQDLKPTFFPAVPRVLNKFHAKIYEEIGKKSGIAKFLINKGIAAKRRLLAQTGLSQSPFWDALVFRKFAQILGGKLRMMICGAAPVSPTILMDFRIFLSCSVLEGYAMTETVGGGCLGDELEAGGEEGWSCGGPFTEVEIKLESVPDMNYSATDPDCPKGEICFRGPGITSGYFRSKELTDEAIDSQGWLHSGDVGQIMKQGGGIRVIDRKKNIFKLAQGEYVCPEKIEQVYLKCAAISQIWICGDSSETFPVAVVVPNEEWVKNKFPNKALNDAEVVRGIQVDMDSNQDVAKLHGFEKAKKIFVEPEPFTIENGLLTPTMKIRRNEARTKYADEIRKMYA